MGIQKEREAFEAYFKDKYPELHKDVFDENGDDRAIIGYSFALSAWQAAKAQAVHEGFVLVPKEPTPKMIDSTWHHDDEIQEMSHNTRNEFIYKSMIKAQEQSHD